MSGFRLEDFPEHVRAKLRKAMEDERRPPAPARSPIVAEVQARQGVGDVILGDPPFARRDRGTLWLALPVVPRTKKNHGRGVAKQSGAAVRFAYLVRQFLAPHAAALGLPLPDQPYNCAAVFSTDGDRADTVGLMQALADALEPHPPSGFVGVLSDDRLIRTWDGTRQSHAPLRPGIVLTLTPTGD